MKKLTIALLMIASQSFAAEPSRLTVDSELMQSIYAYLSQGGTFAQASELARQLSKDVSPVKEEDIHQANKSTGSDEKK